MTAIVSSRIILDNTQADGRRVVIEQFTDDAGIVYQQSYMADETTDVNAKLAADADYLTTLLQSIG